MWRASRKRTSMLPVVRLAFLFLIGVYGLLNLVWFRGLKIDGVESFLRSSFKVNPAKTLSIGVGIWLHGSHHEAETGPADTLQLMNVSLDFVFRKLSSTISDPSFRYRIYIISRQSQDYWVHIDLPFCHHCQCIHIRDTHASTHIFCVHLQTAQTVEHHNIIL